MQIFGLVYSKRERDLRHRTSGSFTPEQGYRDRVQHVRNDREARRRSRRRRVADVDDVLRVVEAEVVDEPAVVVECLRPNAAVRSG